MWHIEGFLVSLMCSRKTGEVVIWIAYCTTCLYHFSAYKLVHNVHHLNCWIMIVTCLMLWLLCSLHTVFFMGRFGRVCK